MAEQTEMRQNAVTGQWSIYAPGRGRRPRDLKRDNQPRTVGSNATPAYDPKCPFCPGNEHLLAPIILELPGNGLWRTRAVPNKYPVLAGFGGEGRCEDYGVYTSMCANGLHEVVIEAPAHDVDLPGLSPEAMCAVVETYHRRYADLAARPDAALVMLLRNHGVRSGASLVHPHAQIMAVDVAPPRIVERQLHAEAYLRAHGRCGYCDLLDRELRDGRRIVLENENFVAFVPYAAEAPFELWIVPREHQTHFDAMSDAQKGDLADALQGALVRLHDRAGDPHYNMVVQTASLAARRHPAWHWFVQIRPRVGVEAGFELATGISIVASLPESDADILNAKPGPHPPPPLPRGGRGGRMAG